MTSSIHSLTALGSPEPPENARTGVWWGMSDHHVLVNRASWDEDAPNWVERGREAWAQEEPVWARGNPESELHLLPGVARLDAVELGCGTAYVSAWVMRRGARVVSLDNSSNQLARRGSRLSSVSPSRSCTRTPSMSGKEDRKSTRLNSSHVAIS